MKLAVAGKGGVGKTTVTALRALASPHFSYGSALAAVTP